MILKSCYQNSPPVKIHRIFSVRRALDSSIYFREDVAYQNNVRLLFHGSAASNFSGILSRGLLLPRIVAAQGGKRTDFGMLGAGLYFRFF